MSEHIQTSLSQHGSVSAAQSGEPERTPGVVHEREEFSFRLILWTGLALILAVGAVICTVGWISSGLQRYNVQPYDRASAFAVEDANRTLSQRLDGVPTPHLEGIERESSVLVVRTDDDEEKRLFAAPVVRVRIGKEQHARLYDLREGQRATLTYRIPSGLGGGPNVVVAIVSPPEGTTISVDDGADSFRSVWATILKIEPRSIAAAREWAEARMNRYGWIDREKRIAHIPIHKAMDTVLDSDEFRGDAKNPKRRNLGRVPSRANSGRGTEGGKP